MIAIIIFIYFVSYNYPMPLYVVFIVSGISLVLAFVGAKIEAWDKPERPVMTKVDPEEDHSFTISSGGQEGIISDGSQIDEVYRIFTEEKKSWQIKIEPPIGSLSEWKCYYDDKAGYVTELKLIFKTKTQVFKRGGKKPGTSEIKCLKKIFTGRRKEKIPYR